MNARTSRLSRLLVGAAPMAFGSTAAARRTCPTVAWGIPSEIRRRSATATAMSHAGFVQFGNRLLDDLPAAASLLTSSLRLEPA